MMRIRGPLDVEVLRRSVSFIVQRHEVMRCTFEEVAGQPVHIIHPPEPVQIPLIDAGDAPDPEQWAWELMRQEVKTPLVLDEYPLVRFRLVRAGHEDHRLLRVAHHMLTDGWSWKIFWEELGRVYEALQRGESAPLPCDLDLQYCDFAAWQRRCLEPGGTVYREQVEWWKEYLRDATQPAPLPFRRETRVENAPPSDGWLRIEFPRELSEKLEQTARSCGTTFYAVCLAAFTGQLAVESSLAEVVLGSIVTNRDRVELQRMFGMFPNFVTFRQRFGGSPTFREWAGQVSRTLAGLQANAEIPYETVCSELRTAGVNPPEIQLLFTLADDVVRRRFGGLEIETVTRIPAKMPWGMGVILSHLPEESTLRVAFDARIHNPVKVRAHIARFVRLLELIGGGTGRAVGELVREAGVAGQ